MEIFDISQLAENNPWWIDRHNIHRDPKLLELSKLPYRWDPRIRHVIKLNADVIYSIRGPRQVGKTTLVQHVLKDSKTQFLNLDIEVDKQRFLSASSFRRLI